jgi:hypothetical protein
MFITYVTMMSGIVAALLIGVMVLFRAAHKSQSSQSEPAKSIALGAESLPAQPMLHGLDREESEKRQQKETQEAKQGVPHELFASKPFVP